MKLFFTLITLLAFSGMSQTDRLPEKQNPERLVNNFSQAFPDFLSGEEQSALEAKLVNFSRQTSNQIVIVIVDDLAGYEEAEYAIQLGDKWGIGKATDDNGIVILIKPTGGKGQRKSFIATGRGLEGAIPDATCFAIVENELLPNFKSGSTIRA